MGITTGLGTTLVATTSSFSAEFVNVSQSGGYDKEPIDTTHFGTTVAETSVPPDLYKGGQYAIEGHFTGDVDPAAHQANQPWTIDFGGSGKTTAFTGYLKDFNVTIPLVGKMTFTATLHVSGAKTNVIV